MIHLSSLPRETPCAEISRSIELDLFREYQRRQRAVALIRMLLGDSPREVCAADVMRALTGKFQAVYELMLSASQQRKARAGYSYEHHIEAMLAGGEIPFEKQAIITAGKRSDFVLPSRAVLARPADPEQPGLILSAKTTLRERWKQVGLEQGAAELYLTTVDEPRLGSHYRGNGFTPHPSCGPGKPEGRQDFRV